jgi:hypothetical protein
MDKGGTTPINLIGHWPPAVPQNGFDWVDGFQAVTSKIRSKDVFLVPRPGPMRHASYASDLYADFGNLPAEREAILRFANTHGPLSLLGTHFHRSDNMKPCHGDSFAEWKIQLARFQQTLDLWVRADNSQWVRRYCRPLYDRKPSETWLLATTPGTAQLLENPPALARQVVVNTVNTMLSASLRNFPACALPGCMAPTESPDFSRHTRATLRATRKGSYDLAVTSADLLTTVWLQFAAYIAGERLLKKCEAPDCGLYMDVTDSPRPGAKKMHSRCEERLRKRRYRERNK